MPDYAIMTDSNSELPLSVAKEYAVPFVRMPYLLDGNEQAYDLGERTNLPRFFSLMRGGAIPTTTTYPPGHYVGLMEPILSGGTDILFISFSSRLSAAFSYLEAAAAECRQQYPERRIELFDSRSISGGLALLVYEALRLRGSGAPLDEALKWLEDNALRANHFFTVGDLIYLRRGGRLSAAEAIVGSMLSIKPILTLTAEGKVIGCDKVKGRRKSIRALFDLVFARAERPEESALIILHGDCVEDAEELKSMIGAKLAFREIFVQLIGPVIGSHAGPDALGVCFLGKARE